MSGTRRKPGRLGPFVEGYRARLLELGYTPGTVRAMLRVLGQLGRWMDDEGVEPGQLNIAAVEAFLAARRAGVPREECGSRYGRNCCARRRPAGLRRERSRCPVDLGDQSVDIGCGLLDSGRREAGRLGQLARVDCGPLWQHRDRWWPRVLVAQAEDLHACPAYAGQLVVSEQAADEEDVDQVAGAVVLTIGEGVIGAGVELLREHVGERDKWQLADRGEAERGDVYERIVDQLRAAACVAFGRRSLELHRGERLALELQLDLAAPGGVVDRLP